jgi:hypothetical protein
MTRFPSLVVTFICWQAGVQRFGVTLREGGHGSKTSAQGSPTPNVCAQALLMRLRLSVCFLCCPFGNILDSCRLYVCVGGDFLRLACPQIFLFFNRQVRFGSMVHFFSRGSLDSTAHSYCAVFRLGASRSYTSLLLYVRPHFASSSIKACSLSPRLLEWTARHISPPRYNLNYIIITVLLQQKSRRRTHPCLISYANTLHAPASTRRRRRCRRVLALADLNGRHSCLSPQTPFLTGNIIPHTWPASPLDSTRNAHTPVHTQRTTSVPSTHTAPAGARHAGSTGRQASPPMRKRWQ